MYTYSRFTSLYSRNQHSIVKQVYANKKKNMGKKKKPSDCGPPGPFPQLLCILQEHSDSHN